MMAVCPSTWQKTSSFCELSSVPRSTTVTGRCDGLTVKSMVTGPGPEKATKPRSDLPAPGTPNAAPSAPSRTTGTITDALVPDDFRRPGRFSSGRSRNGPGGDPAGAAGVL